MVPLPSCPLVFRMYSNECSIPSTSPLYMTSNYNKAEMKWETAREREGGEGEGGVTHTVLMSSPNFMPRNFFKCLTVTLADVRMTGLSNDPSDSSLHIECVWVQVWVCEWEYERMRVNVSACACVTAWDRYARVVWCKRVSVSMNVSEGESVKGRDYT